MVLGKVPVPGRPTIWVTVGQGPTALAVGAGGGCLDIFTLVYSFSPLSPFLWETARYRLKYCLKGPLNPKQTNQVQYYFAYQSCDSTMWWPSKVSPYFNLILLLFQSSGIAFALAFHDKSLLHGLHLLLLALSLRISHLTYVILFWIRCSRQEEVKEII